MIKVAICDDEEIFVKKLKECLYKYKEETGKKISILEFHDGSELLKNYQTDLDLIFLDIKMEKVNGLKTAEEIRKIDNTVEMVFLTSLSQYVWKGYEYRAINYLLKPIKYGRLKMELIDSLKYIKEKKNHILVFKMIMENIKYYIKI